MGEEPNPSVTQGEQFEHNGLQGVPSTFAQKGADDGARRLAQSAANHKCEHEGISRQVADFELHHADAFHKKKKEAHVAMVNPKLSHDWVRTGATIDAPWRDCVEPTP